MVKVCLEACQKLFLCSVGKKTKMVKKRSKVAALGPTTATTTAGAKRSKAINKKPKYVVNKFHIDAFTAEMQQAMHAWRKWEE